MDDFDELADYVPEYQELKALIETVSSHMSDLGSFSHWDRGEALYQRMIAVYGNDSPEAALALKYRGCRTAPQT
jgi:hypothetical protein